MYAVIMPKKEPTYPMGGRLYKKELYPKDGVLFFTTPEDIGEYFLFSYRYDNSHPLAYKYTRMRDYLKQRGFIAFRNLLDKYLGHVTDRVLAYMKPKDCFGMSRGRFKLSDII